MKRSNAGRTGAMVKPGLHICPSCNSKLVQPVRKEKTARPGYWRLWRHCPNCDWRCEGMHEALELNAYDRALKEGAKALETKLRQCERDGIRAMAKAFSTALEADLITADDFR